METIIHILRTRNNRLNIDFHKKGLHNFSLCNFCEEPEKVKIFTGLFKISTLARKFN